MNGAEVFSTAVISVVRCSELHRRLAANINTLLSGSEACLTCAPQTLWS
jgi:hypothetical protein